MKALYPCILESINFKTHWQLMENTLQVVLGVVFLGVFSQIYIPLGFTPVPITGQTFAVLVMGSLLGPKAVVSTGLYLLIGAIGMPVFAQGGSGVDVLIGSTGGYLLGFLLATSIVGYFTAQRGWDRHWFKSTALMTVATFIIFACGLMVLSFYIPSGSLLMSGLYPFLPGAVIKILLASTSVTLFWKLKGTKNG